jgi:hypothetical protein
MSPKKKRDPYRELAVNGGAMAAPRCPKVATELLPQHDDHQGDHPRGGCRKSGWVVVVWVSLGRTLPAFRGPYRVLL